MKKRINYIYIALIFLTLLVAGISSFIQTKQAVLFIVLISIVKFNLVGFEFMELRKANGFWKFMLICYSIGLGVIFSLMLGF
jgi:hypothetical protein